jgi:excisionase family DNA binding protein
VDIKKEASSKRFYTVPEAAELLRVSEVTLYREIRENRFPALKIRGRYVVPAKAIDELEQEALAAPG